MPELPEVETIVRELNKKLIGEEFAGQQIFWKKTFVNQKNISLSGTKITNIQRLGKYIIIYTGQNYLIVHLRMTGQLLIKNGNYVDKNHLRVLFNMKSGLLLLFYDARKFGRIYFTDDSNSVLEKTGMDALSRELTAKKLSEILSGRKGKIKTFLMDQHFIAGLGNIYTDEILFRSKIHPQAALNTISDKQISTLYLAIKTVLESAISNMGTTISDYKTTGGGFGENQHDLKVYGREKKSCYNCGTAILKIKMNGRGTHFCPKCQKLNSNKS